MVRTTGTTHFDLYSCFSETYSTVCFDLLINYITKILAKGKKKTEMLLLVMMMSKTCEHLDFLMTRVSL